MTETNEPKDKREADSAERLEGSRGAYAFRVPEYPDSEPTASPPENEALKLGKTSVQEPKEEQTRRENTKEEPEEESWNMWANPMFLIGFVFTVVGISNVSLLPIGIVFLIIGFTQMEDDKKAAAKKKKDQL